MGRHITAQSHILGFIPSDHHDRSQNGVPDCLVNLYRGQVCVLGGGFGFARQVNVQTISSCPYSGCGHGLHHLRFALTMTVRPTFSLPLPGKHAREVGPSFRRVQTSSF